MLYICSPFGSILKKNTTIMQKIPICTKIVIWKLEFDLWQFGVVFGFDSKDNEFVSMPSNVD